MKNLSLALAVGLTWTMAIHCPASAAEVLPGKMAVQDKLNRLAAGAIRAGGWMQQQMEEDAAVGYARDCQQMSLAGEWMGPNYGKKPYWQPYLEHSKGAPAGGEYQAHWMDLVFRLGWISDVEEYRALSKRVVDEVLAHAEPEGYLGAYPKEKRLLGKGFHGHYQIWGYGELLNALTRYYRYTGDPQVRETLIRETDRICKEFGSGKRRVPGSWYVSVCNAMVEVYRMTGDDRYLRCARHILDQHHAKKRWEEILDRKLPLRGHSAGWALVMRPMLLLYRATGDRKLLDDLLHAHKDVVANHLQPHGSTSGHWERLAGTGPYLFTELCDPFWWVWWWTEMVSLTGQTEYADLAEKGYLNCLPGHRSKDGSVMAYMMCPNQLVTHKGARSQYTTRLLIECCQSNGPRILPIVTENMVMATPDGGLAVVYFGQSTTKTRLPDGAQVTLTQKTDYPFEEVVRVEVDVEGGPKRFPLKLRLPGWCKRPALVVDGERVEAKLAPGTWASIERQWKGGEVVELTLPMDVAVHFWRDAAAYVQRGPLLYALHVPHQEKPLDEWGSFDAWPAKGAAWNYALLLDPKNPAKDIKVKQLDVPEGSHVWEHSPIALEVSAVRLPDWQYDAKLGASRPAPFLPMMPSRPYQGILGNKHYKPPKLKVEKIRLVPFGFTLLRMTYLPWTDSSVINLKK